MDSISINVQDFIKQFIHLIDNNRFVELFEEARVLLYDIDRRALLRVLDDADISYLLYMNEIPGALFGHNTDITEIVIPGNIKRINFNAFAYSNVQYCTIEDGCELIGPGAFRDCTLLSEIDIPTTVKEIKTMAFQDVSSSLIINYAGTSGEWEMINKQKGWLRSIDGEFVTIKCRNGLIQEESA